MPSSDYTNAVGGGLKLKGVKDAGVKKHKKKKAKADAVESKPVEGEQDEQSAIQTALAEEEGDGNTVLTQAEADVKEFGKTEAQRRHEERRRKRVSLPFFAALYMVF